MKTKYDFSWLNSTFVLMSFVKIISLVLVIFCIASCENKKDAYEVPPNIMSEEDFVLTLTDIYLAESMTNLNVKNISPTNFDSVYAFNPIADRGFTKQKFDSSLAFYSTFPGKFKYLLGVVAEKMEQQQAIHNVELQNKKK